MRIRSQIPTAAILAGGLGTRLLPAVADRPKALAPVAGRPFVARLLDQLEAAGLQKVILLTGHRAEQIRDELGERYGSLALCYSRETMPLGTGGAVRLALDRIETDSLLLLNGDSYSAVDLDALARFHEAHAGDGSLVLAHVEEGERFGQVRTDSRGRIVGFEEKGVRRGPGWINAGLYLLSRPLLEDIPAGRAVSLERELFPRWAAAGRLHGFAQRGEFIDIGTPDSYARAEAFLHCAAR